MKHHSLSSKWLLLVFLTHSTYFTATHTLTIPRLSPVAEWETTIRDPAVAIDKDKIKTFYYKQILDHFNYRPESYTTFQQRYLINFEYWGGANSSAPIFAYFGAEAPIDNSPNTIGFLVDNAASFNALLVYIEHRYYGRSVPFGSREEALKNGSTIGYFNSAQAIADYAAILIHIKKKLHTHNSPVIVIGGSYGGMLASWFRLKYPHLAVGALASSAPILYFDNITPQNGYYSVVTRDYREASETCYETIQKSWSEIHRVASLPDGLSILSHRFNTCKPLNEAYELMEDLRLMYVYAAQYNHPPRYPVNVICGGIDGASFGRDILSKIFAGVVAYKGNTSCKVNAPTNASETTVGWKWQTCSEMVIPIGIGNDSMFEPIPFSLKSFAKACKKQFGVSPRPHWITTYYGGHGSGEHIRQSSCRSYS
ncbi:lysosomal Pro-X carboxypeptidase-like isoform X3 [Abrus precatorius]|uniref:Lysosomal Pro-X carboxypeptidase-like isoform X3 n=1 Tax=Abrus precatorius TaxID=3816 RepID=A0A8B8M1Z3_ABRPR|nr:lysosomal Pro-X carboxypeptidase-like isoform X3 [Abrus precatorius]